MQITTDEIDK